MGGMAVRNLTYKAVPVKFHFSKFAEDTPAIKPGPLSLKARIQITTLAYFMSNFETPTWFLLFPDD